MVPRGNFSVTTNSTAGTFLRTPAAGQRAPCGKTSSGLPLVDPYSFRKSSTVAISCSSLRTTKGCGRSEEHTSELQSPDHLVCRLLLEKKKNNKNGELGN